MDKETISQMVAEVAAKRPDLVEPLKNLAQRAMLSDSPAAMAAFEKFAKAAMESDNPAISGVVSQMNESFKAWTSWQFWMIWMILVPLFGAALIVSGIYLYFYLKR